MRWRRYNERGEEIKKRRESTNIRLIQNTNKETQKEKSPSSIRRLLTVLHDK